MPPSSDLASARVQYDAARQESAARLNEFALRDAELHELAREKPATDPAVIAAEGARDAARKALRDARAEERRARGLDARRRSAPPSRPVARRRLSRRAGGPARAHEAGAGPAQLDARPGRGGEPQGRL